MIYLSQHESLYPTEKHKHHTNLPQRHMITIVFVVLTLHTAMTTTKAIYPAYLHVQEEYTQIHTPIELLTYNDIPKNNAQVVVYHIMRCLP